MSIDDLDPKQIFSAQRVQEVEENSTPNDAQSKEINALAMKVAAQFATDSVAPFLITGLLRVIEFAGLIAIALAIHQMYVTPSGFPSANYFYAIFGGSFLAISFIQALDGYDIIVLRSFISQTSKVIVGLSMALLIFSSHCVLWENYCGFFAGLVCRMVYVGWIFS